MITRSIVPLLLSLTVPASALAEGPAAPPGAEPAKPAEAPKPAEPPKTPLVTIYGMLNLNLQTSQARGATTPAQTVKDRLAVSTDSTNLGLRGGLDVNPDLGVLYQCETTAALNGLSVSGICNRNSRLGLTGRWGTLFYGNWDTPFKGAIAGTKVDDPLLNTDVFGYAALMGSPGFNYRSGGWVTATPGNAAPAAGSTLTGFDIRANNAVAYHSPKWHGLSAKILTSVDTFKNGSGTQDPRLYSGVVNYDVGPFSLFAAGERHDDGYGLAGINAKAGASFGSKAANDAGTDTVKKFSRDQAWRIGAGYEIGSPLGTTTIGGVYEQLEFEQNHTAVGTVKRFSRPAVEALLKHRAGKHEFRARFNDAGKGTCALVGGATCSTRGYGAYEVAAGYAYFITKDAQVYVHYARIENESRAQYTFPTGGSGAVAGATPAGADAQALGLGLRYVFSY